MDCEKELKSLFNRIESCCVEYRLSSCVQREIQELVREGVLLGSLAAAESFSIESLISPKIELNIEDVNKEVVRRLFKPYRQTIV